MTKTPQGAKDGAGASTGAGAGPGTALPMVVTPHEVAELPGRVSLTDGLGAAIAKSSQIASRAVDAASTAIVAMAETAAEAAGNSANAAAQFASTAATEAAKAAKAAGQVIGQSVEDAGKAGASVVASGTASATQASAQLAEKASKAAAATLDFVGDLNGDGRFDAEDLQIAKAAISKVAVELGAEAVDLAKGTMQHPLVRDTAAGAVVAGTVAVGVSLVGVPAVAAGGAAVALYRVTAGSAEGSVSKAGGKIASGAAGLVKQALKSAAKPQRKRRSAKPKP